MFKIKDGRSKFYQWDLDRQLIVDDETITQVHFCNRTDDCSLVVETFQQDGLTLANVPNVLLQTDWDVNVYAYDGKATKHSERFEVERRTKPADYVYTETEIKDWETLKEEVETAIDAVNETNDKINNALEEVEKDIADVNAAILNLYPVETQSGMYEAYTDVAAANMPLKEFIITDTNKQYNTKYFYIYQTGKNLCDPDTNAYVKGSYISADEGIIVENPSYAYSNYYIPVMPSTDYVFSDGIAAKGTANTVAFYDKDYKFIERFSPGTNAAAQFKTHEDCYFIRFNLSANRVDSLEAREVMLEVGTESTEYEPFNRRSYTVNFGKYLIYKEVDLVKGVVIDINGNRYNFTPADIKLRSGINHFTIRSTTTSEAFRNVIKASFRVDPTLAYNKLKG